MKDCKAAIKIGNAGVREGMVFMWGKELMIGNPSGAFKKTNRFLVFRPSVQIRECHFSGLGPFWFRQCYLPRKQDGVIR